MKKIDNVTVVARNTQIINATKKHVTNSKTEIPVGGEMVKPATLIAVFQASNDTRTDVVSAYGAYKAALEARENAEATRATYDEAMKAWVLNRFGGNSQEAHDFGYAPRKVTTPSVATKAQALLLNAATRKARGTMGPKAKLKIKGTLAVPAVVSVPTTAPAAMAQPVPVTAHVTIAPVVQPAAVTASAPVPTGASSVAGASN
jgi:hypothetical protein